MSPQQVIMGLESNQESRSVLHSCMIENIEFLRVDLAHLKDHQAALQTGLVLPVGSVAYMTEAMAVAGRLQPDSLSYHPSIVAYLGRPIHAWLAGELRGLTLPRPTFIKPQRTKLFTGFVFKPGAVDSAYATDDLLQLQTYLAVKDDEWLWTSPVVQFTSEWRYYVAGGTIIGSGRYDLDGAHTAASPDERVVRTAASKAWLALQHPFALDAGVLSTGETVVVELNDAWAIGLYGNDGLGRALRSPEYLSFLFDRWCALDVSGRVI